MRKKLSRWAHGDHGGHGSGPNDHGSVTARRGHGSVTARRGHSSVTARSQLSHGEVTAQSRHLQYDHGSVTAQSRPRSRLNHGWLWPFWSPWAHREQSRWPIFFSWAYSPVTLKFDGWSQKTIGNLFHAPRRYVCNFITIGEFKFELPSGNTQIKDKVFHPV